MWRSPLLADKSSQTEITETIRIQIKVSEDTHFGEKTASFTLVCACPFAPSEC